MPPYNWPAPMGAQGSLGASDPRNAFGSAIARNWPQPMADSTSTAGPGTTGPPRDTSSNDWGGTTQSNSNPAPQAVKPQAPMNPYQQMYSTQAQGRPSMPTQPAAPAMAQGRMQPLGGFDPSSPAMQQIMPYLQQLLSGRAVMGATRTPYGMGQPSQPATAYQSGGNYGSTPNDAVSTSGYGGAGSNLPAYTTSLGGSPPAGYTSDYRSGAPQGGGYGSNLPAYATVANNGQTGYSPATYSGGGGAGGQNFNYTTDTTTQAPQGYVSDWRGAGGGGAGSTLPGYGYLANNGAYSLYAPQTTSDYQGPANPWAL